MCILLSRCPPTACFGLWDWVVWVAACKVTVAADSAMFNQSRGPIVMVWAMDFVNTWRRTGISWGRWDMTLVWSAPRWCRQGQQFCKTKFELKHKLKYYFNHLCIYLEPSCKSVIVSRFETHMLAELVEKPRGLLAVTAVNVATYVVEPH